MCALQDNMLKLACDIDSFQRLKIQSQKDWRGRNNASCRFSHRFICLKILCLALSKYQIRVFAKDSFISGTKRFSLKADAVHFNSFLG